MKTKTMILISFLFLTIQVIGQENTKKIDFRLGAGISLLGTGDMLTFNYENELNLKLNHYFTSSLSLNLGKSINDNYSTSSFVQGNLNVFISPFKNSKRNDFRVGTGLTYYKISETYYTSAQYENGVLVDIQYNLENRRSYGFNVIIEDTYLLTDKFLIGLKLFTQPYYNGDINSGAMLKFGMRI